MSENSATVPTLTTGSANLPSADRRGTTAQARPGWRSVTVPTEHGGWGLTLEPGLLGLLVAPGMTSLWLALAAMVAFTARTPLKIVAVDLRRNRVLPRTRLAGMIGLAELAVLAVLVTAAVNTASHPFWWPLVVAAPLVALEAVYEVRSKGRRLAPELAGAIGVCAVVAMAVVADGADTTLAVGLWLILAARALTSVSWVRGQITRIHGRNPDQLMLAVTDVVTVAMGLTAVLLERSLLLGALALPVVIAIQRSTAIGDPVRPAVQGMIQMFMGLAVVAATAIGVAVL